MPTCEARVPRPLAGARPRLRACLIILSASLGLGGCVGVSGPAPGPIAEDGVRTRFGVYLSARLADQERDADNAARFLAQVMGDEPDNLSVLNRGLIQALSAGRGDMAMATAQDLARVHPGHGLAELTLTTAQIAAGRWREAEAAAVRIAEGPTALMAPLLRAWVAQAQGRGDQALGLLEEMERLGRLPQMARFHRALILDQIGRPDAARTLYESLLNQGDTPVRVVEAYADFLDRRGDREEGRRLLARVLERVPDHVALSAALVRLNQERPPGGMVPAALVPDARRGAAETLYGIGGGLAQDGVLDIGAVYLQLALAIDPGHEPTRVTLGELMIQQNRVDAAVAVLDAVPPASIYRETVQLDIARGLAQTDQIDAAAEVLRRLAAAKVASPQAYLALGDLYRERERYGEAVEAYNAALPRIGTPGPRHWRLFFARGASLERLGRWSEAQTDLELALMLAPNEPVILNYLGYAWLEQGQDLDRARRYIERAVSLAPDDGYIVDSLGWSQFRAGAYRDAVESLEKAVQLKPQDATINHHLGDAYWKVGRKLEARFQWSHALAFKPDPQEAASLRRKLDLGLDLADKAQASGH